jgi:hypothetical protein
VSSHRQVRRTDVIFVHALLDFERKRSPQGSNYSILATCRYNQNQA